MKPAIMNQTEDVSLIHLIARKRDKAAFEELLKRHQRMLYAIAFRITNRGHLAEEAVQQTMLSVWLTAEKFRASGSARGWLVAILASKSFKIMRSDKRRANRISQDALEDMEDVPGSQLKPEQTEMQEAVRNHVSQLPLAQRQVLALYFSADLSQREIGEALQVPQRTVSHRLKKALDLLKANLTQAGFASALPLLVPQKLQEIFQANITFPETLQAETIKLISEQSNVNPGSGFRPQLAIIIGLLLVLATVAGLFAWNESTDKVDKKNTETLLEKPEDASASSALEPKSLYAKWTFESDLPKTFLKYGNWDWYPPLNGKPGFIVGKQRDPRYSPGLVLPVTVPQRPFVMEISTVMEPKFKAQWTNGNIYAVWDKQKENLLNHWTSTLKISQSESVNITMFFKDRYIVSTTGKRQPYGVNEFRDPYPSDHIVIVSRQIFITSIVVREPTPEELKHWPDSLALVKQFERQSTRDDSVPTPSKTKR